MTIEPDSVLTPPDGADKPKKILDQTRDVLRLKHYSLRTERSYCDCIERFIRFHQLRHPHEMVASYITQFLTHLYRVGIFSAASQNHESISIGSLDQPDST